MNTNETKANNQKISSSDRINSHINSALRGLKYGNVIITVHDSRIVQIERIEKSRINDLYVEDGEGI